MRLPPFAHHFLRFHVGLRLKNELAIPFNRSHCHRAALVFEKNPMAYSDLLAASFAKEWLLIKRNSFVYIFKTVQIILTALIVSTVFLRTRMRTDGVGDGGVYIDALLFGLIVNMFNGFAELSITIGRLPVFYKHRDLLFHPAWVYTLPNFLLTIPMSVVESIAWLVTTYYSIGFAPETSRFFKQLLLIFLI